MAKKMLTKKQALAMFNELYPKESFISDAGFDEPARREAWNNFTDALHKEGKISERQYNTWTGP